MILILVQKLYRVTIYKQCHYSVVTDVDILICYEHGYVIYMLPQHLCTAVYIFTVFNGMTIPLTFLPILVGLTSKQLDNSSVFKS